tara:strand:+ start:13 stop:315 length:303 start_codon:yes stop_codon:yes gene_type:complete
MYRVLPYQGGDPRAVAEVLNNSMNGKTNNTGTFSTTVFTTSATLNDERIGYNSVILFMPLDHDSSAELIDIYFDNFAQGSCTVNYGNHATARNYRYIIVG